jgi:hypothetical protein
MAGSRKEKTKEQKTIEKDGKNAVTKIWLQQVHSIFAPRFSFFCIL